MLLSFFFFLFFGNFILIYTVFLDFLHTQLFFSHSTLNPPTHPAYIMVSPDPVTAASLNDS